MNYKEMMERIQSLENIIMNISEDLSIAKKEKYRQKTQSVTMRNMSRALCVDTMDPWKENRVRFYHPVLHEPDTPIKGLPFARPVSAMGGFDDCGLSWVPPAGSTLIMMFDNGNRDLPYYFGTTWHRDRGAYGRDLPVPVPEYQSVHNGHRGGYLLGPNDESQVLPPWNTESYNGNDIKSVFEFTTDPEEQKRTTYPNIYGFKTPEKHMLKLVDGNAKCMRRWKRLELMSSCGNWFIMKDDHIHYGGQWAHPSCLPPESGSAEDVSICSTHKGDFPFFTDPHGKAIEAPLGCGSSCDSKKGVSCGKILGGHPSTPGLPPDTPTKHYKAQGGANKFFKHQNECRPYKGPGTPQNNTCDLPQSGMQMLSIGGHTMVMDDSVEEPFGAPIWERSMEPFSFGCNNKCLGVMYMKSMTGHEFTMSDVESEPTLRGKDNYIQLRSAAGNKIQLNDHTIGEGECTPSPPNYAGPERGIHIQSTSKHEINLCDHMNEQASPCRSEGGTPQANATQAYIQIRSGYGLEMRFNDDNSQQETQSQWIQITNPQCSSGQSDPYCNRERGPHFMRFQARPQGEPGIVFLRAGGHAIRQTYDMDIVLVGDKEKNPSDKFTYVSKMFITSTEDIHFRYSGELHIFFAEKYILLMAGRDCPPPIGKKCKGPCLYPVVVGRCPVVCPITGIVHWTEKALSERVFASAWHPCQVPCQTDGCPPPGLPQPCQEDVATQDIDTGNGIVTVPA